jgi:hypothetical protein
MDTKQSERLKPAPRTGAAGWGDRTPESDVKSIVDRVMDPERRNLPIKKGVTSHGH